jgi:mono/diheme cytochrome c family protein
MRNTRSNAHSRVQNHAAQAARRLAPFSLAVALLCFAASGLLYAQIDRGDYTQANLGALAQPAPHTAAADAKYSVGSYPLYFPQLEPGQGKEMVEAYCNACHSPRYILMQPPLTRDQWAAEVTKMVKTFGIDIPEETQPVITKYLQDHYAVETRKK